MSPVTEAFVIVAFSFAKPTSPPTYVVLLSSSFAPSTRSILIEPVVTPSAVSLLNSTFSSFSSPSALPTSPPMYLVVAIYLIVKSP